MQPSVKHLGPKSRVIGSEGDSKPVLIVPAARSPQEACSRHQINRGCLLTDRCKLACLLVLVVQLRLKDGQDVPDRYEMGPTTYCPVVALVRLYRNRGTIALDEVVGIVNVLEATCSNDGVDMAAKLM